MDHVDQISVPHTIAVVETQRAVWLAGPTCLRHEIVIDRSFVGIQGRPEPVLSAWLIPEPTNPHDPSAVIVWLFGAKVGYLPRDLAIRWQPVLGQLHRRYGTQVACQAAMDPPSHANRGVLGIAVWLPTLLVLQPGAAPPRPHVAPAAVVVPPPQVAPAPVPVLAPSPPTPAVVTPPEELARIREEIVRARIELDAARRELRSVEEALDIQAFGFYQARYGFESSAQYVVRLKVVRDEQQALLKADTATHCATEWKVGGSAAEGRKMVKNQSKLMLRAFNGECDAAIAKVKYDNVTAMEERITKSSEAVNKLGLVQHVSITNRYFGLKLAELRLVHEHREKIQQEKDEQRRVKEQMREEQQAQAEIDRAKADAEKEEAVSTAALAKAKAELEITAATGKQHEKLEALVLRLETELTGALDCKAKAIARAQLTRSGHVYVLSNIGSFGDGIYKIGMTRRLEPLERVDELGDASVPFPFDVHAIIYSEDAPQLEHSLHKAFAGRRVNMVNHRKEYFRVTLDDIRDTVQKLHGLVTFLLVPEAEEYRKTRAAIDAPPVDPAAADVIVDPNWATE
jgi:hypothetical protein